jgi:nitroreductase
MSHEQLQTAGIIETIDSIRSIRNGYTGAEIPEDIIEDIVQNGLHAPSSKNAQPWKFHIVPKGTLLTKLAETVQNDPSSEDFAPIDVRTGEKQKKYTSTVRASARILGSVSLGIFIENLGDFGEGKGRDRVFEGSTLDTCQRAQIGYGLEMIGIGMAIDRMRIAAKAHGLESVFMGDVLTAEQAIRAELGMQGDLVGVIALGENVGEPSRPRVIKDQALTVAYHS